MAFSMKLLTIPLSLLLFAGCSSEEVAKETKEGSQQVTEGTEKAAEKVKEGTQDLTAKIKEETPILVQNMKDSYKDAEQKAKDNTLQKGDKATTQKDAYLALTPEAYDELYQLIEVNNLEGVESIIKEDQVKAINKGIEVEILERDIRRTKVKMSDSGEEGYLPTNLLEPLN